jgi:hypothetical protein
MSHRKPIRFLDRIWNCVGVSRLGPSAIGRQQLAALEESSVQGTGAHEGPFTTQDEHLF